MTYTPYYPAGWDDSPSTLTPIIAAALQNIENGIETVTTALATETTRAETAEALTVLKANNLSDLANAATARTNLGLGTAATQASSAFDASGAATTAQTNAQSFATSAVAVETARAEAVEAGLAPLKAWQFQPESYGAKGDMVFGHDFAITSGQPTLTSVGVVNPSIAPTFTNSGAGGTVLAGTYQAKYTFATAFGETTASPATSTTSSGSTSTLTVTAPAIVPGGALGWNAYITAVGGSTFFKQNAVMSPWPFQNNFILTTPPNTSSAQPPGSNTTVSNLWASMSAGQAIRVVGAGAAGADLRTTILSVGGSSATLNANAGTTVSAVGAVWGTDDTTAIQAAINAASAYTVANNRTGEVVFSKLYLSNTAPTVGGNYAGNCVIQLPLVPDGQAKQRVSLAGVSKDVSTLPTYQQMVPEMSGTGIIYIGPNGTNDANYGPASVIGTPILSSVFVTESGNKPGTTNIKVMMDSLRIVVPFAGGIGGIDLFSAAESANYNCSVQALGIIPTGGSWTTILANGPTTNQWGWGLREPGAGNNAVSYTEQFTCEGLCYGYGPSEHLVAVDIFCAYCVTGIEAHAGNGISMVHNAHILSAGVELCTNAVGGFDGGIKIDIDNLRTETDSKIIFDPSNRLQGTIGVRDQNAGGVYKALGSWVASGAGTGVRLVNLMTTPGPLAAPQATVASGSAWFNGYFRDAWITLSATTITALTITGLGGTATPVAQNGLAGSPATYGLMLPAGCSYTATYTGTLSHSVTLF